jgi:hypothetical protein
MEAPSLLGELHLTLNQQELLHLQVIETLFDTFFIVIETTSFQRGI